MNEDTGKTKDNNASELERTTTVNPNSEQNSKERLIGGLILIALGGLPILLLLGVLIANATYSLATWIFPAELILPVWKLIFRPLDAIQGRLGPIIFVGPILIAVGCVIVLRGSALGAKPLFRRATLAMGSLMLGLTGLHLFLAWFHNQPGGEDPPWGIILPLIPLAGLPGLAMILAVLTQKSTDLLKEGPDA
jgi:hypothetical protein